VNLTDLMGDVLAKLPQARKQALDELVKEYGAGETFHFLMALAGGTTKRERHLLRLFLRELDRIDQAGKE
jgi:hypothetical protein